MKEENPIKTGALSKIGELTVECASHWIGKYVFAPLIVAIIGGRLLHGTKTAAVNESIKKRAWVGDDLARHTERMNSIDSNSKARIDFLQFEINDLSREIQTLTNKTKQTNETQF